MEEPLQFLCNEKRLYGVLHIPDTIVSPGIAVTMVTGGPQTRFGGHRLYVQLARFLCLHGFLVFRFDYEGMGDSDGDLVGFRGAGPSIISAIDFLRKRFPEFSRTIIWSICDGCPVSLNCAVDKQQLVGGLILVNPLVIDEGNVAYAHIKHHYARRLFTKLFWKKLFSLQIRIGEETKSIISSFREIVKWKIMQIFHKDNLARPSLKDHVIKGIVKINRPIWFIYSTKDIVALEFRDVLIKQKKIQSLILNQEIIQETIDGADHTFTDPVKKKELFQSTLNAVNQIITRN